MTKIGTVLTLSIILVTSAIHAQNINNNDSDPPMETIMGKPFSVRGFLSLDNEFTRINNQSAYFTGGGVQVVFNHRLNIGFMGMGMLADIYSPNTHPDGYRRYLQMGYGGIKIEPVFGSYQSIHVTLPVLFGSGAIVETDYSIWDEVDYNLEGGFHNHDYEVDRVDVFFLIQPGIHIEANLFKHMRLAAGAKYRFIDDVDLHQLKNADFEGLSGSISLRFGWL